MTYESARLDVRALACVGGHARSLKDLESSLGRCACRGERWNVTIERTLFVVEKDDGVGATELATSAAQGLLTGVALNPGVNAGIQRTTYDLFDVDGRELLRRLKGPVGEASAWIHELRLAHARANLKPDQRICAACDTIFRPPRYGPLRDDFCSPACRRTSTAAAPAPSVVPASKRLDVACPHCGKVLKLRGNVIGKTVACPSCSKKFGASAPS